MARRFKYDLPKFEYDSLALDNIDRLTMDLLPEKKKVLELGCATGYHTQFLKEEKGCTVVGVDLSPVAIKHARKFAKKAFAGDLDQDAVWKKIAAAGPYDVCLASNVLEHLLDPWTVLKRINSVLKPNGQLVAVVPNIGWWRARWKLLQGEWNYEEYGMWDKTHTKFFTLPSFRQALNDASFTVRQEAYDPAGGAKWFTPILRRFFPNAYAYQAAFSASKKKSIKPYRQFKKST
jgi:2-polyprenyl-3-methyl-5-hydroxy-6-metoxy-1,4-benzoquinol methylase